MSKLHFLYITINLINGHYYIGKHSTDIVDDGYLGSGKILLKAIKKYGRKNFKRFIIDFYDSEQDVLNAERLLVNNTVVNDHRCYNCKVGGLGFHHQKYWIGKKFTDEHKEKLSKAHSGKTLTSKHKEKISHSLKKIKLGRNVYQFTRNGILINEFDNCHDAGSSINKSHQAISACCTGKRKTAYNYIWSYDNKIIMNK